MRFLKAEKKITNSQKKLLQILILCESEKELFSEIFVSLLPVLVSFCKNGVKAAEKEEKLAKSRTNLYKSGVKRAENVSADCHTNFHLYHYAGNNPIRYTDPDGRDFLFVDYNKSTNIIKLTYYTLDENNKLIDISEYSFTVTNKVRNELNGLRQNPDVTTSPLNGKPNWYYPRQFPNGFWAIKKSIPKDGSDPYLGLVFIPTTAYQEVPIYGDATDSMPTTKDGCIPESIGVQDDTAYGFHFSSSNTTLGCGRCDTQENASIFAEWSDKANNSKNGGSYVYVHE